MRKKKFSFQICDDGGKRKMYIFILKNNSLKSSLIEIYIWLDAIIRMLTFNLKKYNFVNWIYLFKKNKNKTQGNVGLTTSRTQFFLRIFIALRISYLSLLSHRKGFHIRIYSCFSWLLFCFFKNMSLPIVAVFIQRFSFWFWGYENKNFCQSLSA